MTAVVTLLILGAFAATVAYIAVAVWRDTPKPKPLTPLRDRQIAAVVRRHGVARAWVTDDDGNYLYEGRRRIYVEQGDDGVWR